MSFGEALLVLTRELLNLLGTISGTHWLALPGDP